MRWALLLLAILRGVAALGLAAQSVMWFAGERTFKGFGGIGRLTYLESKLLASSGAAIVLAVLIAGYLDARAKSHDEHVRASLRLASRLLFVLGFVLGLVVFVLRLP